MTYREYAKKNVEAMLRKEPSPQDMRDIALLSLWLDFNNGGYIRIPPEKENATQREFEPHTELADIFPALSLYQSGHSAENLKKLCVEIEQFCHSVYASTQNETERKIFKAMLQKLNTI